MRDRRPLPPLWLYILVGAALALVGWMLQSISFVAVDRAPDPLEPQQAIWGFILGLVGLIWQGVQIAYDVLVIALQWSVKFLWTFATATYNVLIRFGRLVGTSLRKIWEGTRALYENVLKPGWEKFWRLFDRVRKWLDRVFGPILRYLEKVRRWILDFYTKYVRPFVDAIGIARKVLRVFASLGFDWAKALDRKLAELQDRLQAPFRLALAKINELVNIVNRVVTLDGLLQRLALIRSIERDVKYVVNAWHNSQSKPLTNAERDAAQKRVAVKTIDEIVGETRRYLDSGAGPHAALLDEWSIYLTRQLGVR
jgi:hypothetical protein